VDSEVQHATVQKQMGKEAVPFLLQRQRAEERTHSQQGGCPLRTFRDPGEPLAKNKDAGVNKNDSEREGHLPYEVNRRFHRAHSVKVLKFETQRVHITPASCTADPPVALFFRAFEPDRNTASESRSIPEGLASNCSCTCQTHF